MVDLMLLEMLYRQADANDVAPHTVELYSNHQISLFISLSLNFLTKSLI